jgi:hypothetical protein
VFADAPDVTQERHKPFSSWAEPFLVMIGVAFAPTERNSFHPALAQRREQLLGSFKTLPISTAFPVHLFSIRKNVSSQLIFR